MKKRDKRISIRTTKEVEDLLDKTVKKNEYKFYSKSDIINLILEESLPQYADNTKKGGKK